MEQPMKLERGKPGTFALILPLQCVIDPDRRLVWKKQRPLLFHGSWTFRLSPCTLLTCGKKGKSSFSWASMPERKCVFLLLKDGILRSVHLNGCIQQQQEILSICEHLQSCTGKHLKKGPLPPSPLCPLLYLWNELHFSTRGSLFSFQFPSQFEPRAQEPHCTIKTVSTTPGLQLCTPSGAIWFIIPPQTSAMHIFSHINALLQYIF